MYAIRSYYGLRQRPPAHHAYYRAICRYSDPEKPVTGVFPRSAVSSQPSSNRPSVASITERPSGTRIPRRTPVIRPDKVPAFLQSRFSTPGWIDAPPTGSVRSYNFV